MVRGCQLVVLMILLFSVSCIRADECSRRSVHCGRREPNCDGPAFDVRAAVDTYLAKMPPAQRARSDAYFEGGYWLQLLDFLITVFVMWLLLRFGLSARMRNLAERITRFRPLQTAIYWVQFIVVVTLLTFPMSVYEGYFREHKYGLLNQTFGPWMRDQVVGLGVGVVLGAILMVPLFGLVRRLGKSWWVWGAVVMMVFVAFVSLIAPVYIAPLFNKYTTLTDARIKDPILSMARANGIPANDVYEFDASRQSNRVSANVSGFAGTMRISLNDNLLKRCTLPEIETTMGHEMGHYVLNHAYKGLVMFGVVIVIGFAFVNWGINYALARWGEQWERARDHGCRGAAAGGDGVLGLHVSDDAGDQYDLAQHGIRGGHVRPERGAATRWRGECGHAAGRVSQARSRPDRGVPVLRSSQRTHAHHGGDAVEGGTSGVDEPGGDGETVVRRRSDVVSVDDFCHLAAVASSSAKYG